MNKALYPRLAIDGIRKNKKLYIPYLLSAVGMVMMGTVIQALSCSPLLTSMEGGSTLGAILSLGKFVIFVFSLLFLFYTNAFLIKRRYKEFGLYSILGMSRKNICRIVLWDALITALTGLIGGIAFGLLFSKLAELGLANMIRIGIDYTFRIDPETIIFSLSVYGLIFLLLTAKTLIKVGRSNPLALMKSEQSGEKQPKANWFFAAVGVLLLGGAYYMSVSIKNPLSALTDFFIAVLMVIAGTYFLFMAGSVALCRILQQNKTYYYKKQHFVSVSNMAYRMKRNGAGLASVCILATMVLVMISSTASLYFGANDAIQSRFPREMDITVNLQNLDNMSDASIGTIQKAYEGAFSEKGFSPQNVSAYRYADIAGMISGNVCHPNVEETAFNFNQLYMLYFISAADYNKAMGTNITLNSGEALLYPFRCAYDHDTLTLEEMTLTIRSQLDRFPNIKDAMVNAFPSLMLVIPDYETLRPMENKPDYTGQPMMAFHYHYGCDGEGDAEKTIAAFHAWQNALGNLAFLKRDGEVDYNSGCLMLEKSDFYATFGGLFFIGITLSVVFIFGAAVIIYYKQLSEGYEDQKRFEIMCKVGMTKQEIKKTINSQILTVFFAPLIASGIHLCFALPFVWKFLQMFNLHNFSLVIGITGAAFAAFAVFYEVIYKMTAKAYYDIVSV